MDKKIKMNEMKKIVLRRLLLDNFKNLVNMEIFYFTSILLLILYCVS